MTESAATATRPAGLDRRTFLRGTAAGLASLATFGPPGLVRAREADALPPALRAAGGDWRVSFEDDFTDAAIFERNWIRERRAGGQHNTLRLPENSVVTDGELRLELGHRDDPKRPFTGGSVQSRAFRQRYGYFECEMRIADEGGVNNAFWLIADRKTADGVRFELDVVEAKYPNALMVTARRWYPERITLAAHRHVDIPLADSFHRYAMLWTKDEFRFFFDDEEIFVALNSFAHRPALMLLSNAVGPFAGKNDGDIEGAATAIRRVRVFETVG